MMKELLNVFAGFWNMFKKEMLKDDQNISKMLSAAKEYVDSYADTAYAGTAESLVKLLCHEFGTYRFAKDNFQQYAEIFNVAWKFFSGHQNATPDAVMKDASVVAQKYADGEFADFARDLILIYLDIISIELRAKEKAEKEA